MGLSLDREGSTLVVWVAIPTVSLLSPLPAALPSAPATLAPQGQGLASPRPRKALPTRRHSLGRPRCALDVETLSTSLRRNWHRPCLRCQRCRKTLTAGSHAEHDGTPYCHIPCYGYLFGPKGVNIGNVGCYIYDPVEIRSK